MVIPVTPPCALAIRTAFSVLDGAHPPAAWTAVVAALPAGQRVALVDRDDLRSLPAAIAAWGRDRIAVGATLRLGGDEADDALLLAPDAAAYRRLCRALSWRLEERPGDPELGGLIALARSEAALARLRRGGAEVWWHQHPGDGGCPPSGVRAALLPVLTHLDAAATAGDGLRRMAARRGGHPQGPVLALSALAPPDPGDPARAAGLALLARCQDPPGGAWHLPPSRYADADGELRQRAEAGARRRYPAVDAAVQARLDHELGVIAGKGFSGYLLTVADLAAGRRTCGRGSGASSLVCYCLGITNVDPIRHQLLFERFLNPHRSDPPDLDVDFPWDERDAVLAAALASYGREHVAMVATHQRLRRWGALREAARAWGLDPRQATAVRASLAAEDRYGQPARLRPPWPEVVAASAHLVGVPLHLGLHCGGMVITPTPIRDLVPCHPAAKAIAWSDPQAQGDEAPPGRLPLPAIAWEKDGAEAMGLVKIDLLGNRSLAVVRDALADLAEDGIVIDEARWRPAEDPATCRLVASGATMGCFYIESPAMRQLQAKAASGDFERLVVHSSIIRPAANRWIGAYLERLHEFRRSARRRDEWYPHPCLRHLLSDSFGILSYQEDVMLAARAVAGFDERQANALRKALGQWGVGEGLAAFAESFRAGAAAQGVAPAVSEAVWGMIASFAGYSFCKAHSASYAMVSFQCAYLKAHHPAHFLARVVANEGGFYRPAAYLEEARRLGLAIRGPCLLASAWATRREGAGAIRCGLHLLPGLARALGERVIAERALRPFAGLADLRRRCRLPGALLEPLARAGALDALLPGANRAQIAWLAAQAAADRRPPPPGEDDDGVVQRLFPPPPDADPPPPALPAPAPRAAAWERWRALGFLPEGHPLWFCALPARRLRCRDLHAGMAGAHVVLTVLPIARKQVEAKPRTPGAAGEPMAFVTCEDESGLVETVWFPGAYRAHGTLLDGDRPLALHGTIEAEHGCVTVTVERAEARAWAPA